MNKNYNQSNKSYNQQNRNSGYNNKPQLEEFNKVIKIINESPNDKTLKNIISNKDLYLPLGWAERLANDMNKKFIEINQIRKIYDVVKKAETTGQPKDLFPIVPLVAYATGRDVIKNIVFFDLISACVNEKRIKDKEDIKIFSTFLSSIIAYFKKGEKK